MIIKKINIEAEGIAFLCVDSFMQELRKRKCRVKKFISYFQKHMDQYLALIAQGTLVPFHPVDAREVLVYIETKMQVFHIPEGYRVLFQYDDFYFHASELEMVTLASFGALEYHSDWILEGKTSFSYYARDKKTHSVAIDFPLPKGEYQVSIIALEKIEKINSGRWEENYAYGFHFTRATQPIMDNLHKCDDDIYAFSFSSRCKTCI